VGSLQDYPYFDEFLTCSRFHLEEMPGHTHEAAVLPPIKELLP